MLDRIAALMENLRQVTNDIAHDLRTPVTHLRHRLERARQQAGTPQDYDKALEAAIAAADDILALFTALLRIAQIEGGSRRAGFVAVDAAALLPQLRDMFTPVADDAQHRLVLDAAPVTVQGDRELLVQLFSNLIENAIVHTPPGTTITLGATKTPMACGLPSAMTGPACRKRNMPSFSSRCTAAKPAAPSPAMAWAWRWWPPSRNCTAPSWKQVMRRAFASPCCFRSSRCKAWTLGKFMGSHRGFDF